MKYASHDQGKVHDKIMKLRNEYVAHSELTGFEQAIVVAAFNPEEPKKIVDVYETFVDLVEIDSILNEFEGLIDAEIRYVKGKYEKVHNLIVTELEGNNIDDLYKDAIDISSLDTVSIKGTDK